MEVDLGAGEVIGGVERFGHLLEDDDALLEVVGVQDVEEDAGVLVKGFQALEVDLEDDGQWPGGRAVSEEG